MNQLRSILADKATGTFGLRIANLSISFLTSWLLAKLIGTDAYGVYVYIISWITLFSVVSVLGFDKLMIRSLAIYQTKEEWTLMRGFLGQTNWIILGTSLVLSLVVLGVFYRSPLKPTTIDLPILIIGLITLTLFSYTKLWQSATRGLHEIIKGQTSELLVRPVTFVLLLIVGRLWWKNSFSDFNALILQSLAAGLGFIFSARFLWQTIPRQAKDAKPFYQSKMWISSSLPLLLSSLIEIINIRADILLLGTIHGTEIVGVYNVVKRLAELTTMVLIAVSVSIGPQIASLYASNDIDGLQKLITKSTRIIFFGSLLIAIGLLVFGPWLLNIWGNEFSDGYSTFVILILGQVINASVGPVALLLVMTKHERDVVWGIGIGLLANIVLNLILIPKWEMQGTAVATLVAMIIWNTLLVFIAYHRLEIMTVPFISKWFR